MNSRAVNAADYLLDRYSLTLKDIGLSQQVFQVVETDCSSLHDILLVLNQGARFILKGYFFFLERLME